MNIIVPLSKLSFLSEDGYSFPTTLMEVDGFPLIKNFIDNILSVEGENNIVFVLKEEDCAKYRIDNVIKVLCPIANFCYLKDLPKGAVCSILMASSLINSNSETIILNADQYFNCDLNTYIKKIRKKYDVGVLYFEAVHPRWAFVELDDDHSTVLKCAEKNPISRNAIAGFYYFCSYKLFMDTAFRAIEFEDETNGQFYTSALINQAILLNKNVGALKIENHNYFTFYSKNRIKEFEKYIQQNEKRVNK
jgi:dTDP-glucose pyrophosphorylase